MEITRDASKAANALKTISQRLRAVGEDEEDLSEYTAKLQEDFDNFGIDIQIVKDDGSMESTYNILSGLAEKWDDLNDAQRQSIGDLAAGKNRITEFNALMGNFEVAISATETALNSENSAFIENEKVINSVEGKWNHFQSALEKSVTSGVIRDIIKDVLDLGSALLETLESIGGITTAIPALISLLIMLKSQQITTFIAGIMASIENLRYQLTLLKMGLAAGTVTLKGFISSLLTAEVTAAGFTAALGVLAVAFSIIYTRAKKARTAITQAFEDSLETVEEEEERSNKLATELDNVNKAMTKIDQNGKISISDQAELQRLKDIDAELKKIKEDQDLVLSSARETAANKAYEEITTQNATYGALEKMYNLFGGEVGGPLGSIIREKGQSSIDKFMEAVDRYEADPDKYRPIAAELVDTMEKAADVLIYGNAEQFNTAQTIYSYLELYAKKTGKKYSKSEIDEVLDKYADEFGGGTETGGGTGDDGDGDADDWAEKWKDAFEKAYDELNHLRNMDKIGTAEYISELTKLNDKYFKDRTEFAEEYMKYVEEIYKEEKALFEETVEDVEHEIEMMENRGDSKNDIIARYEELQDMIHEKAEYYRQQGLDETSELIQDLQDKWWEYADKIKEIQEEIKDDIQEKYEAIRDAIIDAIDEQIEAEEEALEERNALIDEQIEKYEAEEEALESQSETEEKLLKIEQARAKLAAAKSQKVRVYRAGQGFVYESDFDAVSEAQSELDELLEDWELFQEKAKIADIVAELEAEKEANEKRTEQTIKDLNALKDAWDKSLDISDDISEYGDYLKSLEDMDANSLDSRLEMVKDFVQAYKEEMAEMQDIEDLTTTETLGYSKDVDYQAKINEAIARGASNEELAALEAARNAKIEGEGLSYEKTYNYTTKASSSSGTSVLSKIGSAISSAVSGVKSSSSSSSSSSSGKIYNAVKSAVSSIGSAIKKVTGLAGGTENSDGMLHLVGENGPEFYVPPKGAGIIPNDLTSNLMALGSMNPAELLSSATNNTSIEIGSISLPGVTDANSFVKELENFKTLAVQKSSLRR